MKYKQIKINVAPGHYDELLEKAGDRSIAQYIREQLDIDLKDKPITLKKPKKYYLQTDPMLIYQINKIGTNVNQIAKRLNSGDSVTRITLSVLIEIMSTLKRLIK